MEDTKKYQICVGETLLTDGHETWPHSFLGLADNCPNSEIKDRVFRQISFDPDDNGHLGVAFSNALHRKLKPHTEFTPIIVGDTGHIFKLWNQMENFAGQVSDKSISAGPNFRFEPTSRNCRTGVRDTLNSVGLTLHIEFAASAAGLEAKPLLETSKPTTLTLKRKAELSL